MSEQADTKEVHRGDPALRRQLLLVLAITIVAGAGALWGLQHWLDSLFATLGSSHPDQLQVWLRHLMGGAGLLVASALGATALWLHRLADDTHQHQCWPPKTLRVSQDVPVRRGESALAQARQLRLSAIALGAMAAAILLWAIWIGWPGPN